MKAYDAISRNQLIEAREIFGDLLNRKTKESDWQRFFTKYPYVLSSTLPLALTPNHIIPMARPGKADPDFVLYPWDTTPVPFYGVVEIKRPDSKIVTVTRSNVALLTRDASTAIEQSKVYVDDLGCRLRNANRHQICLGNRSYIFIIMGLQKELSEKLGLKLFREQIEGNMPKNLQLLPYDSIFEQFSSAIPSLVMFVVPQFTISDDRLEEALKHITEEESHYWDSQMCG